MILGTTGTDHNYSMCYFHFNIYKLITGLQDTVMKADPWIQTASSNFRELPNEVVSYRLLLLCRVAFPPL